MIQFIIQMIEMATTNKNIALSDKGSKKVVNFTISGSNELKLTRLLEAGEGLHYTDLINQCIKSYDPDLKHTNLTDIEKIMDLLIKSITNVDELRKIFSISVRSMQLTAGIYSMFENRLIKLGEKL